MPADQRFAVPSSIVVQPGCSVDVAQDLLGLGVRRPVIVHAGVCIAIARRLAQDCSSRGLAAQLLDAGDSEPTVGRFAALLGLLRQSACDAVIGIGGGSALDQAKLLALLVHQDLPLGDLLAAPPAARMVRLVCLPTTAGTGSEVSPNALLLDETDGRKRAVITPLLVPDAAYIDSLLTHAVPSAVTAWTGIDALTHCIEAYASKRAHPLVDAWALRGIELIGGALARAVADGVDAAARADLALGSMLGGLCLGPVNTGGVHAMAYPLNARYRVPHGLANALLLPIVLEHNLPAAPARYAAIARALGCNADDLVATIRALLQRIRLPGRLGDAGVRDFDVERSAGEAIAITRLMERNPRTISHGEAVTMYRSLLP